LSKERSALEGLAEKWRRIASLGQSEVNRAMAVCAGELEAALAAYPAPLGAERKWICTRCKHEHKLTMICLVDGCQCDYAYIESVPATSPTPAQRESLGNSSGPCQLSAIASERLGRETMRLAAIDAATGAQIEQLEIYREMAIKELSDSDQRPAREPGLPPVNKVVNDVFGAMLFEHCQNCPTRTLCASAGKCAQPLQQEGERELSAMRERIGTGLHSVNSLYHLICDVLKAEAIRVKEDLWSVSLAGALTDTIWPLVAADSATRSPAQSGLPQNAPSMICQLCGKQVQSPQVKL
jgi:hypothetical protein